MPRREVFTPMTLGDPALAGLELRDFRDYINSRDDADLPALLPGVDPMRFHYRRLTHNQLFRFVETAGSENERFARAFMAGIVRITGGRFGEVNGADGFVPDGVDSATHVAMTMDEAEEAGIAPTEMIDIGQQIYIRSIAPKAYAPRFPLQPMCLLAWDALDHPSAERTRATAAQNSDEPKGE